ncbi:MAG: ATP-grasp domain-containing protein [Nitrospirae bacterium]|nr:MAG: ATP-grasp domain-containing protein [Nitrospirota bacterium]
MSRILLLLPRTTYRAESFLEAAARLKLRVTVGCEDQDHRDHGAGYDRLTLNFRDAADCVRTAVGYAAEHPIQAILGVDDNTAILAAILSAALGLPHNSVESVSAARNKYRMRELLREHGVPVPSFTVCSLHDDPLAIAKTLRYPCVVKPVLSASCGVIRADTPAEFTAAFHRVFALLRKLGLAAAADDSGRLLLVEDFVSGREVALEGLLTDGKLRVLALFDKPDPLDGPFFEETIYITPSRLPLAIQADIAQCAAHAAEALGLREGPVHGEMRVNATGVWMIELAARSIGGRCSRTLRFAAGLSLEEVILRHALRMALPELNETPRPAGVMMLPIWKSGVLQEVRGQMDALAVPGVEELVITAQAGEELIPLPEGTRYLGFLIARGEHPEAVEATLREAYRRLEVVIIRTPSAQVLSF